MCARHFRSRDAETQFCYSQSQLSLAGKAWLTSHLPIGRFTPLLLRQSVLRFFPQHPRLYPSPNTGTESQTDAIISVRLQGDGPCPSSFCYYVSMGETPTSKASKPVSVLPIVGL